MPAMQDGEDLRPARRMTVSSPRLAYTFDGPEEGVCVVLLHGVASSSATWSEMRRHLGPEFRYLAVDYRGHGASEGPPGPYRLDDFVADHFRLLDEIGIASAHVVGFSIGAIFAQAIALAAPSRARSLVLLNSIGGRTEVEQQRAFARLELIRVTPPAEVAAGSVARWFTRDFIAAQPHLVDAEREIVASISPASYACTYEVLATTEILSEAQRITAPTLIVTGEFDEGSTPEMSRKLHARISGSRLVILPGVKHYLHIEEAEALGGLITRFLREQT